MSFLGLGQLFGGGGGGETQVDKKEETEEPVPEPVPDWILDSLVKEFGVDGITREECQRFWYAHQNGSSKTAAAAAEAGVEEKKKGDEADGEKGDTDDEDEEETETENLEAVREHLKQFVEWRQMYGLDDLQNKYNNQITSSPTDSDGAPVVSAEEKDRMAWKLAWELTWDRYEKGKNLFPVSSINGGGSNDDTSNSNDDNKKEGEEDTSAADGTTTMQYSRKDILLYVFRQDEDNNKGESNKEEEESESKVVVEEDQEKENEDVVESKSEDEKPEEEEQVKESDKEAEEAEEEKPSTTTTTTTKEEKEENKEKDEDAEDEIVLLLFPALMEAYSATPEQHSLAGQIFFDLRCFDRTNPNQKITLCFDCRGSSGWPNANIFQLQPIITTFTRDLVQYHPGRLKDIYIFPVPQLAVSIFELFKSMLPPVVQKTTHLVAGNEYNYSVSLTAERSGLPLTLMERMEQTRQQQQQNNVC